MDDNIIWQVDLNGEIYEADTDTLTQWILDGYVFPNTRVKKGSLAWLEAQRVPSLREVFNNPWQQHDHPPQDSYTQQDAFPTQPEAPTWNQQQSWTPPQEPQAPWSQPQTWAPPTADAPPNPGYGTVYRDPAATGEVASNCMNHFEMKAKYVCTGCNASLCRQCVKLYGNAAICLNCKQPCRNLQEHQENTKRLVQRTSGFGIQDFVLALKYPFKDWIGIVVVAIVFGMLQMFLGRLGNILALGILLGYISHAIRRISLGHIEDGPAPDLSDIGEVFFTALRLVTAIAIVTFGPLIAVVFMGISSIVEGSFDLLSFGAGFLISALWALLYYPMALLVAGYTDSFFAVINPLVGIDTIRRMGLTYVKAYVMYLIITIFQFTATATINIALSLATLGSPLLGIFGYIAQNILASAVYFITSMMVAAVLGLAVFKSADDLELDL